MIRVIALFASCSIALMLSSPVAAQMYGGEDGIGQDEEMPTEVNYNGGLSYGTAIESEEPVLDVRLPFTDQHQRHWELAVNVVSRRFDLYKSDGSIVRQGFVTYDQAAIFRALGEQARRNHKYSNFDYLQPAWVDRAIEIITDILIAAGFYTPEDETGPAILDQQALMCASMAAAQTSNAFADASASCPPNPSANAQGKLCYNRPEFSTPSPDRCRGALYSGICIRVCE